MTNGSITESSTYGSHHEAAPVTHELGGSWTLWNNLAQQSEEFGHPEVFYDNLPDRSWHVATLTIKNTALDPYIERLTNRDLHDNKVNTGGIVTITDSNWLMSFAVHRQPHFKTQAEMKLLFGYMLCILIQRETLLIRPLLKVQVKKLPKSGYITRGTRSKDQNIGPAR